MNDVGVMSAVVMFVLWWYGLTLVGRKMFRPYENLRLVWCPELRSFSYIEVQTDTEHGIRLTAKNCLLWPEYSQCKSLCLSKRSWRKHYHGQC
jgi:hypothetical protein